MAQNMLNEFIHNGVEVRRCHRAKPHQGTAQLYCSQGGKTVTDQPRFISVTRRSANEVKPSYRPNRPCGKKGGSAHYMDMPNFGSIPCHILVYEAWIGERTPGMQIDHINGVAIDKKGWRSMRIDTIWSYQRARKLSE